ncbi:hypothetical protein SCA6_004935 [Theobroma cacao]
MGRKISTDKLNYNKSTNSNSYKIYSTITMNYLFKLRRLFYFWNTEIKNLGAITILRKLAWIWWQEFMAEVEVRAAHNVIEACAQTDTIDKVVFTSSATAVVWRDTPQSVASDLDERHWSDENFCRKFKLWEALSKTLTEKTAWALAMDRGINMVSVNGGLLTGPHLSITNPYLKGAAEMYEAGTFVTVDLNFLVDAHICVFEDVSSYGRYLCFNHVINRHEDAVQLARLLTPSVPSPAQSYEEANMIIQQKLSNKKLNKLLVDFESEALET